MNKVYIALLSGIRVMEGTLEEVIEFIRFQEADMDRSTQHSRWTVGVRERN